MIEKPLVPAPTLYILMRNDLASMNAGKAMAQASHASNAFIQQNLTDSLEPNDDFVANDILITQWRQETDQGFGTVIVLEVNEREMRNSVDIAQHLGYPSEVIHDPTYPLRDGDTTHFIPLDTCAYVFGDRNDPVLKKFLGLFNLHP